MPAQYFIPPSFENIIWPGGQDINDPTNYNKYLYNDSGLLIWKTLSSFSIAAFLSDTRVHYKFNLPATYTGLSGTTFTQIKDSTPNNRHIISFTNSFYVTNLNAPLSAITFTAFNTCRAPTTILPPTNASPFFIVFVVNFAELAPSNIFPVLIATNDAARYCRFFRQNPPGTPRQLSENLNGNGTKNGDILEIPSDFITKWSIIIIENSGGNLKTWLNGSNITNSSGGFNMNYNGQDIALFNVIYTNGSDYGGIWANPNIYYDELFVLENSAVTQQNREKIEGLFAWKHGFADKLISSHPYKSVSP
jgi:hypothetical protein